MIKRPLATLALFSCNQVRFVGDAVAGALAQSYQPLQIVISDDGSSDGTFERIQQLTAGYGGPHRVVLNRNAVTLGLGAHVNHVMELCEGEFVVAAAGDDISDRDRVASIVDAFAAAGDATYSVWSAARYIDEAGRHVSQSFIRPREFTDASIVRNVTPVLGATHAWRRQVFDLFGPLLPGVMFEDNAVSFRSYLLGPIAFINRELVSYRTHAANITNFTPVADWHELYRSAARRAAWHLQGLEQREKDLAYAVHAGLTRRNAEFLQGEIAKQRKTFELRVRSYELFPSVSFDILLGALRDVEIAKVVVRSFLTRARSSAS